MKTEPSNHEYATTEKEPDTFITYFNVKTPVYIFGHGSVEEFPHNAFDVEKKEIKK